MEITMTLDEARKVAEDRAKHWADLREATGAPNGTAATNFRVTENAWRGIAAAEHADFQWDIAVSDVKRATALGAEGAWRLRAALDRIDRHLFPSAHRSPSVM